MVEELLVRGLTRVQTTRSASPGSPFTASLTRPGSSEAGASSRLPMTSRETEPLLELALAWWPQTGTAPRLDTAFQNFRTTSGDGMRMSESSHSLPNAYQLSYTLAESGPTRRRGWL